MDVVPTMDVEPTMDVDPPIQAIESNGVSKEEEVDELLAEESDFFEEDENDDPNEFRIREPLPEYKEYKRKLSEVHQMVHYSEIDLNPPYQREVVWHDDKQSQLIESIFRNYTVPQVVFAVRRDDAGDESRICVDGKQRLTSIVQFFDGLIPYKDPVTKKKFWYITPQNQKGERRLIPQRWKDYFCNKTITISEYDCITPLQERDVFQRVQLGVPLKPAQKLKAITSPWVEWISLLEEKHISIEGGLSTKINFDTTNARDFQNMAGMIYCCYGLENEPAPLTTPLHKWLAAQKQPPDESFKKSMEDVLRTMWVLGEADDYNEGFVKIGKKVAPIEFVFIGVLLYMLRDEARKVQGRAVYILRCAIRNRFKDVKNNNDTSKACWKFVNQLWANPTVWLSEPIESQGSKRKRDGAHDDIDDFAPSRGKKKTRGR